VNRFAPEQWISWGFDQSGKMQARAIHFTHAVAAADAVATHAETDYRGVYQLGAVLLVRAIVKPYELLDGIAIQLDRGLPPALGAELPPDLRGRWTNYSGPVPPRRLTGGVPDTSSPPPPAFLPDPF
jgi:hypothetical protein